MDGVAAPLNGIAPRCEPGGGLVLPAGDNELITSRRWNEHLGSTDVDPGEGRRLLGTRRDPAVQATKGLVPRP